MILYPQDIEIVSLKEYERLLVTANSGSVLYVQEMNEDGGVFGDKIAVNATSSYFGNYGKENKYRIFCTSGTGSFVIEDFKAQAQDGALLTTGWATYVDTDYPNSGTAFTLAANTDTVLPNNAGSKIETQKPVDVVEFYNVPVDYDGATNRNAKITGRNGDNLDCMVFFKAVPSAANQYLDIWVDIGGSVGELYRQTFQFPKGAGEERGILYALPSAYTLGTWEANGGTVYVRSNASCDIYSINYNFDRSHKAI